MLKDTKTLVVVAMFMAISLVLASVSIFITPWMKLTFSFLPEEIIGYLFGPVIGGIMGGMTDLLQYLLKPAGPYFPGFTLNATLSGIIYGLILYGKPISLKRILVANFLVTFIAHTMLGTIWLSMLYGKSIPVILPMRCISHIILFPLKSFITYVVMKTLQGRLEHLKRPVVQTE